MNHEGNSIPTNMTEEMWFELDFNDPLLMVC